MSHELTCTGSDFCDELRGSTGTSFALTYGGDPPSRTIAATLHLRLVADLSPLIVGHLLLLPVRHELSFAHVVGSLGHEIEELLTGLIPSYAASFGRFTVLEHGSSTDMNASCITHAHWHVVPLDGDDVCRVMERDGLLVAEIDGFRSLSGLASDDRSYFYCAGESRHRIFGVGRQMRRQYLRSVIGEVIGIADPLWDYALVVRKNLLRETMAVARTWRVNDDNETGLM